MSARSDDDDIQVIVPGSKLFSYHNINYHDDSEDIIIIPNLSSMTSPRSPRSDRYPDTEIEDQGFFESYESSTWERHCEDGLRLKPAKSRSPSRTRSNHLVTKSEADLHGGKRLVSQKQFHKKSNFVRARYPSHLDSQEKFRPSTAHKHGKKYNVPSSFCPATRYNREPRLMDTKERKDKNRPWPKPPQYDPRPKKKNVATECEILKLVQTMDIGTQNVPIQKSTGSQATKWMINSSTQYPRAKLREKGIQAPGVKTAETAIQNVPRMKNKFVETPIKIMYYPHLMVTEDIGIQCTSSESSCDIPILHVTPSTPVAKPNNKYEDDFDSDTDGSSDSEDEDIPVISYIPDEEGVPTLSYFSVPSAQKDIKK